MSLTAKILDNRILPACSELGDVHVPDSLWTLTKFKEDNNPDRSHCHIDREKTPFTLGNYMYKSLPRPHAWKESTWIFGRWYSHIEVIDLLADCWTVDCLGDIILSACSWPAQPEQFVEEDRFLEMFERNVLHFMATGCLPTAAYDAFISFKNGK